MVRGRNCPLRWGTWWQEPRREATAAAPYAQQDTTFGEVSCWREKIEPSWSVVKESYPDAIVFHEARGLYVVKGRDTQILAKEFRIDTHSPATWYGFDERQALG